MTTTPIQVSTDLSQVLSQINQKLDNLQKEVSESRTETRVAIAEVKGDIKSIDQRLKNGETSQKNQAWTLIGILATAVLGILVAGGKILFFPNL